jgi:uncharacterized protein (TIGR03437 family)
MKSVDFMRFPRSFLGITTTLLLVAAGVWAQEPISSVRIYTEPKNLFFYVDGQPFSTTATLFWPAGSKHVLCAPLVQYDTGVQSGPSVGFAENATVRYLLLSLPEVWTTNLTPPQPPQYGGIGCSQVTADPELTFVKAEYHTDYRLALNFCPHGCLSPGLIEIKNCDPQPIPPSSQTTNFTEDGAVWITKDCDVGLRVTANPGWIFAGWAPLPELHSNAFLTHFILDMPRTLYPKFTLTRDQSIRIDINPSTLGLKILADRTAMFAPITGDTLQWGRGTTHTVGVISPQTDVNGNRWVFDSWSDGGAATHTIVIPQGEAGLSLTVNFKPGTGAAFSTSPAGLKLTIDGQDISQYLTFSWAPMTTHTVSAPARQVDGQGRAWLFDSWSNGGSATQNITVPRNDVIHLAANYKPIGLVTLQSEPPGLTLQMNGADCKSPCTVERALGTQVQISAPGAIPLSDGMRYDLVGMSDSGAAQRAVTAGEKAQVITANYHLRFRLATTCEPAGSASWNLTPASPDGFFDAQSRVSVTAGAQPGYRFRQWEGDATGIAASTVVELTGPKSIRALMDRVPYISQEGVKNAAGDTPRRAVSPGSIISIYGFNLGPPALAAPPGPLPQTLNNVTVRVAGRLLPLLFVSPDQINAQLSAQIEEGPQKIIVRWEGQPEASADFTVARNAPGLFRTVSDDVSFAVALHEDGSTVNADKPARPGERITVFATGIGPINPVPLDGFPLPADQAYELTDHPQVSVADAILNPVFSGAAPGQVGLTAIRFQVPSTAGEDKLPLKILVNGVESNTAFLSVKH